MPSACTFKTRPVYYHPKNSISICLVLNKSIFRLFISYASCACDTFIVFTFFNFFFFFFFGVHPFPRLCQLQHPNIRLCFSYRPYLLSPSALPLLLTYIYDVFLSLSTTFHKYFQTSRPSGFFMKTTTETRSKDTHTYSFSSISFSLSCYSHPISMSFFINH